MSSRSRAAAKAAATPGPLLALLALAATVLVGGMLQPPSPPAPLGSTLHRPPSTRLALLPARHTAADTVLRCARARTQSAALTMAISDQPIEILETRTETDGKTRQTFGFRITGSEEKPFIKMTMEAGPETELVPVTVGFPGLGVILEQKVLSEGPVIVVDDKEKTGTAIDDLEVGDILRAFSAVYTVTPPADTLSFYANPPKKVNVRGMFQVDGKNFAKTIAALQSNGELVDRFGEKMEVNEISLVVERKKKAATDPASADA